MKVLLFSNHYPASDAPTRVTYNHNIFRALARTCEVRVVGPIPWWLRARRPGRLILGQRDAAFGLDASFPSFWSIPGVTPLHGHATFLTIAPELYRVRRAFPFDVVVGSNAYPDGVGAADLAAVARVPLVQNVIGSDVNELPRRRALRPQILWALRRARRVIAVSRDRAERAVALGVPRERVVAQHNGVDGATFSLRDKAAARAQVGLSHPGPVILYVGNVKVEKGVPTLVEAMAPLARAHGRGDALLCVVGSGEADAEVAAAVRSLGLERSVRLCGRQLHDDIPRWMSACDVLCLPSFMEGCPNVVLEGLATGRAIVATSVGGIPELVTDGHNGVLVPPRDPEALARGLAAALSRTWDPSAQRASVAHLSDDAVAARYREVLEEAVREHRE